MTEQVIRYCVDGHLYDDAESDWDATGSYGPYWIFDIEAQDYVGAQYPTRSEAEDEMDRLFPGQGHRTTQEELDATLRLTGQ